MATAPVPDTGLTEEWTESSSVRYVAGATLGRLRDDDVPAEMRDRLVAAFRELKQP
jgi:hypothetical protein